MKHILLVEDDLSMLNGLSFAIKKQGYALDIARTRDGQKQLWTEDKYDLVILDVSLPDGSGFDICQEIRKTSTVPIMRALPVSQVWGLSGITNTPVSCKQAEIDHVTICSYDDFIMGCSKKSMIVNGTLADTSGNKNEIMTIYNKDNPLCRRRSTYSNSMQMEEKLDEP